MPRWAIWLLLAITLSSAPPATAEGQRLSGRAATSEELRIRIENRPRGAIMVSRDKGASWHRIGQVVQAATTVNRHGYNASRWVPDSTVAATAVNAIHIKVTTDSTSGRGVIFSIVPADKKMGAATNLPAATMVTNLSGGRGIFGGLGPCVSSPVYQVLAKATLAPLAPDYQPAIGDILVIIRRRPAPCPRYIDFENKFGGLITVTYDDGERKVIGQVLRPVVGVGRFEGTVYAAPGRLRANHAAAIDISTSPLGLIGGFQIIPRQHANDPEVWYIRSNTQWMVVGPLDGREPSWEGIAPLFSSCLYPSYRSDDITGHHQDWFARVMSRCQVLVKTSGESWELLPRIAFDPEAAADSPRPAEGQLWRIKASTNPYVPLPSVAHTALQDVTHIRIVLPRQVFWPAQWEEDSQHE